MANTTWRIIVSVAILSVLGPWLFDVARFAKATIANRPNNLATLNAFSSSEIRFTGYLRNCEDITLDTENGVALLSCSPGRDRWNTVMVSSTRRGRATGSVIVTENKGHLTDPSEHGTLYIYPYSEAPNELPIPLTRTGAIVPGFHPIGIAYDPVSRALSVANHGGINATLEIYELDLTNRQISLRKSFQSQEHLPNPNAIAFINTTHAYVSNTHRMVTRTKPETIFDHVHLQAAQLELRAGLPFGFVSLIDLRSGEATRVLNLPFANGVKLFDNGKKVAVASSSKLAFYIYDVSQDYRDPIYVKRVKVPFFPDNIGVDSRGHLYVAGHADVAALGKMAAHNWRCYTDSEPLEHCHHAPSWVVEWDPNVDESVALKTWYVGTEYPSSAAGTWDAKRNVFFTTGLYANGILVGQK